jgi:hypothetical protein
MSLEASKPQNGPIQTYIAATVILSLIALYFQLSGFPAQHPHWIRFFCFKPSAIGWDITSFDRFRQWRQYGGLVLQGPDTHIFNFCPFAFFVILCFLATPYPFPLLVAFGAFCGLAAAVLLWRTVRGNRTAGLAVLIAVCTSYPFLFLFVCGNIEGTTWVPAAAGVYYFTKRRYLAASLLFALAACIKPFPAMLFLLLLPKRRFREFFIGIIAAGAVSVASLFLIGPSFQVALEQNLKGFETVHKLYLFAYQLREIGADHSLFSFCKQIIRILSGWPMPETISSAIRAFYPYYVAGAAGIFLVSMVRLWKLPTLNQIFGICVLMILISPINNDYTLIDIYIPWAALLVVVSRAGCTLPRLAISSLMISCAVLFTPQFYIWFGGACFGAAPKTLALLGILGTSLIYPMPAVLFGECEA